MAQQTPTPALLSKTLRFLTAGGLTLAIAVAQEAIKAEPDWMLIATMVAGIIVGIGGGAYGRVVAQGPVTSLTGSSGAGGAA